MFILYCFKQMYSILISQVNKVNSNLAYSKHNFNSKTVVCLFKVRQEFYLYFNNHHNNNKTLVQYIRL